MQKAEKQIYRSTICFKSLNYNIFFDFKSLVKFSFDGKDQDIIRWLLQFLCLKKLIHNIGCNYYYYLRRKRPTPSSLVLNI